MVYFLVFAGALINYPTNIDNKGLQCIYWLTASHLYKLLLQQILYGFQCLFYPILGLKCLSKEEYEQEAPYGHQVNSTTPPQASNVYLRKSIYNKTSMVGS